LQEIDASVLFDENEKPISIAAPWLEEQRIAFAARGVDMGCAPKLKRYLKAQGFVEVSVKRFRWMHGPWEGHPETLAAAKVATEYNGAANFTAYKRVLEHTKTAAQLYEIREQMLEYFKWSEDGRHRGFWVGFGRKPGN
jgi:hypothetical protein